MGVQVTRALRDCTRIELALVIVIDVAFLVLA
jgi:hypothetical protein